MTIRVIVPPMDGMDKDFPICNVSGNEPFQVETTPYMDGGYHAGYQLLVYAGYEPDINAEPLFTFDSARPPSPGVYVVKE